MSDMNIGRQLSSEEKVGNRVAGLSAELRDELLELVNKPTCTDSAIEDFIGNKPLSDNEIKAVWTQIDVWTAPDCCKACKNVGKWRNCSCSRPYKDEFVLREENPLLPADET